MYVLRQQQQPIAQPRVSATPTSCRASSQYVPSNNNSRAPTPNAQPRASATTPRASSQYVPSNSNSRAPSPAPNAPVNAASSSTTKSNTSSATFVDALPTRATRGEALSSRGLSVVACPSYPTTQPQSVSQAETDDYYDEQDYHDEEQPVDNNYDTLANGDIIQWRRSEDPEKELKNVFERETADEEWIAVLAVVGNTSKSPYHILDRTFFLCRLGTPPPHEFQWMTRLFDRRWDPVGHLAYLIDTDCYSYSVVTLGVRLTIIHLHMSEDGFQMSGEFQRFLDNIGFDFEEFQRLSDLALAPRRSALKEDIDFVWERIDALSTVDNKLVPNNDNFISEFVKNLKPHETALVDFCDAALEQLREFAPVIFGQSAKERQAITDEFIESPTNDARRNAYNASIDEDALAEARAEIGIGQQQQQPPPRQTVQLNNQRTDDDTPPPRQTIRLNNQRTDDDSTTLPLTIQVHDCILPHTVSSLRLDPTQLHALANLRYVHVTKNEEDDTLPPVIASAGFLRSLHCQTMIFLVRRFYTILQCSKVLVLNLEGKPGAIIQDTIFTREEARTGFSDIFGRVASSLNTMKNGSTQHFIYFPNAPSSVSTLMFFLQFIVQRDKVVSLRPQPNSVADISLAFNFTLPKIAELSELIGVNNSSHLLKTLTPNGRDIFATEEFRKKFQLELLMNGSVLAKAPFPKFKSGRRGNQ